MSTRDLAKRIAIITCIVIVCIVVFIAVFFPLNGKLVCKITSAPGDPSAIYTYTADFKLWKVTKVESKQVVTSKDKKLLEKLKEEQEQADLKYKDSTYFTYSNTIKGKELTSITTINYQDVDIDEIVTEKGKSDLIVRNLKKLYQKGGATCSYK